MSSPKHIPFSDNLVQLVYMLKVYWGTIFQVLISLAHSIKYPYKPINYFVPPQIFPTYYPNISHMLPNLGSHKYSSYNYPTWAPTNISHTSTINYFGPTQYFSHIITQLRPTQVLIIPLPNWATKLYHLYKSPNSFTLWAKPKNPNKTLLLKPVSTRHF